MAVHMFRIVTEKPPNIGEVQVTQLVGRWLATHTPWGDDPTPNDITFVDDPITDAPQYFRGDIRFKRNSEMATISSQIKKDLADVTSWHRIAYHKCSHDESKAYACSWDSVTDYGDVPNGVPTFE